MRRASRRTLVSRRGPAGGNRAPGRTLYRGCRLRRRLRRFAAARAIALHRRLRAPRCRPCRNVQKNPETSLTWELKDEIIGRGKVYYAKLARGKTMFLRPA